MTLLATASRRTGPKPRRTLGRYGLSSAFGIENLERCHMMEFHISRTARERYRFADTLFSFNGNVVFADLAACRAFAYQMNQVREAHLHPDRAVHAGQLFAMGLIDEASHL